MIIAQEKCTLIMKQVFYNMDDSLHKILVLPNPLDIHFNSFIASFSVHP